MIMANVSIFLLTVYFEINYDFPALIHAICGKRIRLF